MAIALGASLAASLVFAWPAITGSASSAGGNPQFAVINKVMASTPAKVAPIYDQTTESLVALLKEKGFAAAEADKPLTEIAPPRASRPWILPSASPPSASPDATAVTGCESVSRHAVLRHDGCFGITGPITM